MSPKVPQWCVVQKDGLYSKNVLKLWRLKRLNIVSYARMDDTVKMFKHMVPKAPKCCAV